MCPFLNWLQKNSLKTTLDLLIGHVYNIPTTQFWAASTRDPQSQSFMLLMTEYVWESQNNAFWDCFHLMHLCIELSLVLDSDSETLIRRIRFSTWCSATAFIFFLSFCVLHRPKQHYIKNNDSVVNWHSPFLPMQLQQRVVVLFQQHTQTSALRDIQPNYLTITTLCHGILEAFRSGFIIPCFSHLIA